MDMCTYSVKLPVYRHLFVCWVDSLYGNEPTVILLMISVKLDDKDLRKSPIRYHFATVIPVPVLARCLLDPRDSSGWGRLIVRHGLSVLSRSA